MLARALGGGGAAGLDFASYSTDYPPVAGSAWTRTAEPFRETMFEADSTLGNPSQDVFKWMFEDGTVLQGR